MSGKGQVFNALLAVVLIVLVCMNGYLIYRTSIAASPQSFYPPALEVKQGALSGQLNTYYKVIHVSGVGVVTTSPDIVVINLGVETQADTAEKAQSENTLKMNAVIEALKKLGVSDADMETISYSLMPQTIYPRDEGAPQIVSFICRNMIAVTIRDISLAGMMIDGAVQAGANEVSYIQFKVSEEKAHQLYESALQNALHDAEKKATTIGDYMGVEISGPIEVTIGSSYEPVPTRYESALQAETPLIPGDLSITVNIQVSYQYQ